MKGSVVSSGQGQKVITKADEVFFKVTERDGLFLVKDTACAVGATYLSLPEVRWHRWPAYPFMGASAAGTIREPATWGRSTAKRSCAVSADLFGSHVHA